MRLEYAKDLSFVDIYAQGDELARFMGHERDANGKRVTTYPHDAVEHVVRMENPVLVTDDYKIGKLEPPRVRSLVHALFATGNRETVYDGTSLMFKQQQFPTVWGPSIDTLLFTRALGKIDMSTAQTAAEIGAGSAFISKYMLEHNPNLQAMTIIDLNQNAIACWKENIQDPRAKMTWSNAFDYMVGKKYDVLICNPPYIPRPKSIDDNAYEGVDLLTHLITTMPQHLTPGGKLIINISSLCETEANAAFEKVGIVPEHIDRMTVPLKVFNVLNNPTWIDYLKTRGLQQSNHDGYEFWQQLNILSATLPK